MNFLGNSTLKLKYKSMLNVRERGYCNKSKTLQAVQLFPHENKTNDHTHGQG